ncbi:MAG: 3-isopropylmalate dehydratase small subunit [Hyphomicrobiaceae bacterium]|nr:3-isopropylmalate dehydratase small subunit [Hyphomicrobiaceae bacterium]
MSSTISEAREAVTTVSSVAVPFNQANVDTDQIIPARFLSLPRDEMQPHLFRDVRYRDDGSPRPEFVLNKPIYQNAAIMVAERNFACGSSREMAVTVMKDNGFRAVIAPSFGDIFYNNCFQNSVLPVVLPEARISELLRFLLELPGAEISIDLPSQTVQGPDGKTDRFEIDPFRKECLLKGIDDITLTLGYESAIAAFESRAGLAAA